MFVVSAAEFVKLEYQQSSKYREDEAQWSKRQHSDCFSNCKRQTFPTFNIW